MRAAVPLGSAALVVWGVGGGWPACVAVLRDLDGVCTQFVSGTQREAHVAQPLASGVDRVRRSVGEHLACAPCGDRADGRLRNVRERMLKGGEEKTYRSPA